MQFFFDSADLQDYVEEASGKPHVGLRDSMMALGIAEKISSHGKGHHNAGNDAVRTLALLAALLTRETLSNTECGQEIVISRTSVLRVPVFDGRPLPWRAYPFTAKVETLDSSALPSEFETVGRLSKHYQHYTPKATGKKSSQKLSKSKIDLTRAWISFPTQQHLNRFITEVHVSVVGGIQLSVHWVLRRGTLPTEAEDTRAFWEAQKCFRERTRQAKKEESDERQRDLDLDSGIGALLISTEYNAIVRLHSLKCGGAVEAYFSAST
jgi:hypothetical protein